jgi:Haemolysin XhlA
MIKIFLLHGMGVFHEMEGIDVNATEKEILMGLARLEAKVDLLGNVREIAIESQQSAKSAHMRLDRLDKVVFWAATTVIGGVILGAIGLLFYFAKI